MRHGYDDKEPLLQKEPPRGSDRNENAIRWVNVNEKKWSVPLLPWRTEL